MKLVDSILNFCVIAALLVATTYWIGTSAPAKAVTSEFDLAKQIQNPGVVLVKFGAEWCSPCRSIEAELDSLAATNPGLVSIVKIDIDQDRALAQEYQVSSIPCLILFQNGKQISRSIGYQSQDQLKAWIASTQ